MAKEESRTRHIEVKLRHGGIFSAFFRPFTARGERYSGLDFSDISALRQLLSNEKARMLFTLQNKKPSSIYQLAKTLGRDFKSVRKDVELLKQFGFIRFEAGGKGKRKSLKPVLNLSRLEISINL